MEKPKYCPRVGEKEFKAVITDTNQEIKIETINIIKRHLKGLNKAFEQLEKGE